AVERLTKLIQAMTMMNKPINDKVHKVALLVTWLPKLENLLSKCTSLSGCKKLLVVLPELFTTLLYFLLKENNCLSISCEETLSGSSINTSKLLLVLCQSFT